MPEQSNDYRVVVFGAGGVGKSSLVLRFVRGTFRDTYVPTIEDTYRQVISCNKQVRISLSAKRCVISATMCQTQFKTETTERHVRLFVCPLCVSGASILWGGNEALCFFEI